jgi:acetyl esterase/lipase
MEGEESFEKFSPEVRLKDPVVGKAASLLPPIILFHGSSDYSIPCDESKTFTDALQAVGAKAELVLYSGKTHTDLFLQVSHINQSTYLTLCHTHKHLAQCEYNKTHESIVYRIPYEEVKTNSLMT